MSLKIKESTELKTMIFDEMEIYRAIRKSGDVPERLQELCKMYPKAEILLEYYPLRKFDSIYLDARITCSPSSIQKKCQEIYERYYFLALLHPLKWDDTTGKAY